MASRGPEIVGVGGGLRGGDQASYKAEELTPRVAPNAGDSKAEVPDGLDDIGSEADDLYTSTGLAFASGRPVSIRVSYAAGNNISNSVSRSTSINRHAPSSVVGVTRPQGAQIGGGTLGVSSAKTTSNGYGYGLGSFNSGGTVTQNGGITGRVSVMSKASNRSNLVSGLSLAGSQPITRLRDPTFYNSSQLRTRFSQQHIEPTDTKLHGLGSYSKYEKIYCSHAAYLIWYVISVKMYIKTNKYALSFIYLVCSYLFRIKRLRKYLLYF